MIRFLAPKIIAQGRYDICSICPELRSIGTCKQCGCIMKVKVRFSDSFCPIGRWGKTTLQEGAVNYGNQVDSKGNQETRRVA